MNGVNIRSNSYQAAWKREGKRKAFSTLIPVDGGSMSGKAAARKAAERISSILKDVDYGRTTTALGESAIMAIPNLPPNVQDNALRLVRELAWDKNADKLTTRQYLSNFKGKASVKLEEQRTREIKRFLEFLGDDADKPLDELSKEQCEAWLEAELHRVGLGTVAAFKNHLSHPIQIAWDDGLIPRHPFKRIDLAKLNLRINPDDVREKPRVPFTVEDIKKLDIILPQEWHDAMLISLLTGGARLGDVMCLRWDSINFDEGKNGLIRFGTRKSHGKIEIIAPMLPKLRARLLELKETSKDIEGGKEYVLPVQAHMYLNNKGNLSTTFTSRLKSFGINEENKKVLKGDRRTISKKSFHSFRYFTSGILEAAEGVSSDLERAIVGHSAKDVHSGYIAFDEERRIHALEAIARPLGWL